MTQECPNCGTALTVSERRIVVHVGDCPSCHHHYSVLAHGVLAAPLDAPVDGEAPMPPLVSAPGASEEEPEGDAAIEDEDDDEEAEGDAESPATGEDGAAPSGSGNDETPVCGTCGSDLVFRATDERTIEVDCPKCGETTRFRAEGSEPPADRPRGPPRFRDDRSGDRGPPRARGCRRCGGPIEFETLPDGGRRGRCANCGNEFRLPPRRDGPGGDFGRGPRRFGSSGGRSDRPPGRYGGDRRYGGGGSGGRRPYRPRPRNDDDSDERPRRRRRDDDE